MINEFRGSYRFLSNFYPAEITLKPIPEIYPFITEPFTFKSVEFAYMAAKTNNPLQQLQIANLDSPVKAKRMGRTVTLRPEWARIKVPLMEFLVSQKFAQNPDLAQKLKATKPHELIEGNYWHDMFWGMCYCPRHFGQGSNRLGKILMSVREMV